MLFFFDALEFCIMSISFNLNIIYTESNQFLKICYQLVYYFLLTVGIKTFFLVNSNFQFIKILLKLPKLSNNISITKHVCSSPWPKRPPGP